MPIESDRLLEHPLARVLHDQPNSWQTAYEFRAMLQAHLSLRGNAYARIVAANGNPVAALLPLHPDRVRPLPERVGGRLAYEYSRAGARAKCCCKKRCCTCAA